MAAMIRALIAALLLCAGYGVAGAQPQGDTTGTDRGPPAQSQVPQSSSGAQGSLSRELSRSGGVIRPPPTHDRSVVAPPNQGASRTPVIPPPGTPGGNPNVKPK
jgi:hypothetical protein